MENCHFAVHLSQVETDWERFIRHHNTRQNVVDDRNDIFLDESARPLQFNFRSNFHQIIDGGGRRERQDNKREYHCLYIEPDTSIRRFALLTTQSDFIVVVIVVVVVVAHMFATAIGRALGDQPLQPVRA